MKKTWFITDYRYLFACAEKLLKIMRISIFLIALASLQSFALVNYAQTKTIDLKITQANIVSVLEKIEDETEFYFFYNNQVVKLDKNVSIELKDKTINEVLDVIFKDTDIEYTINDRQIILSAKESGNSTNQQQKTISGKVTDSSGVPLPGVTVLVKGTTNGNITDGEGRYSLSNIPENATLQFSFVGMKTQEIPVRGKTAINVTLVEETVGLDEVIAVGYSSKSRTEISSSISTLNNEKLQTATSPNIVSMLQGKVAGLQVMQNQQSVSGEPDIRIHGTGSLSADSKPLWVVDGVIGGSYDPNDVATVTVLKDAGATGIYGSRAANGVIVVTTKTGKSGQKQLTFESKVGFSIPNMGNVKYLNGTALYPIVGQGFLNAGRTEADFIKAIPASLKDINFDWMNWLYSPKLNQSYNLAYSGSEKNTTFYLSANYYNEDGLLRGTSLKRASSTMNLTHKISDNLKINFGLYGEYLENDGNQIAVNPGTPFDRPYHPEGSVYTEAEVQAQYILQEKLNPALVLSTGSHRNTHSTKINPHFVIDYNLLSWMSFSSSTRLNFIQNLYKEYQGIGSQLAYSGDGAVINQNSQILDILNNEIVSLNKKIGAHSFSGLIGVEFNEVRYQNLEATCVGLLQGSQVLSAAAAPKIISGTERITTYNSYFSQVNYNYLSKYFLTGSYRIDGSSRFGINNRYGQFYSLSGSWLMTNEAFIKNLGFVNELKLRASYGLTGNANIDDYSHLNTYSRIASYDGKNASTPLSKGNPDLTWEVAKTFDTGFNLGLFNRINMILDYYYKKNDDLLYNVPLDGSTGYDQQWRNVGRLDNWGIDFSIQADVVKAGKFKWNSNFQIGYNQDKVKRLPNAIYGDQILEEGCPHYEWYFKEWAGVDSNTGAAMWYLHDKDGNRTGTTKIYSQADRIRAGKASPDYVGGLSNEFSYSNFTLGIDLTFAFGHYNVLRSNRYDHDGVNNLNALQDLNQTRWMKPGDNAEIPIFIWGNTTYSNSPSTRYIENGNFLKVSNVMLAYDFPNLIVQKLSLKELKLFVRGENLKVFTKADVFTPEYGGFNGMHAGQEISIRNDGPFASKYIFGINVKF